jgi:hypothetical protein
MMQLQERGKNSPPKKQKNKNKKEVKENGM